MVSACLLSTFVTVAISAAPSVHSDYAEAYRVASSESKMLLVGIGSTVDLAKLDEARLGDFVLCAVGKDATIETDGKQVKLSEHPSFSDMDGAGVAVIDFKHDEFRGEVVSVLPDRHASASRVNAVLELPAGSLTQRTLIWALRVHPEQPMSVWGTPAPELMAHAKNHSRVQASSNNQHHNLPVGIASSEIVAESWPWNNNVVDAAIDVVDSWRQSPGHWGAARRSWTNYGYDMKHNGSKWFATGVFR